MRRPWTAILFLVVSIGSATTSESESGARVALLIGNADYAGTSADLDNPVNDVTALGASLRTLGFEVMTEADRSARDMRQALYRFRDRAEGAEIALFFFAGHGMHYAGDNLLVGTSFDGGGEDLPGASLAMAEIRSVLEDARPDAGLILLDACRNTPIQDAGIARAGLVRTRGGAGLLIAYATDPGNVAYDGTGENSVFTAALLKHVSTPGLDVRLMLGRVRQEVVVETYGRQVPWVEEALIGDHHLSGATTPAPDDPVARELRHWRAASTSQDPAALGDFLAVWPDGEFADIARHQMGLRAGPEHETASSASSALLAAATAQKLRTDLVALRSVDRLLRVSENALREIEEIAQNAPEAAAPVLAQARRDIEAISLSRGRILVRLDESRGYYADLVAGGSAEALSTASLPEGMDAQMRADAELFLRHVGEVSPSTEGSFAWLADFL